MFCLVYIQENKTDHAMGLDWQNPVLEGNANTEASVTDMPVQSFQPLLKFSYYTVKCAIFLFCDVTWSFFLASYLQTITPNTCSCSYFHFWKSGLLHCFLKYKLDPRNGQCRYPKYRLDQWPYLEEDPQGDKLPVTFLETSGKDALLPHLLQDDDAQHAGCKGQQQQERVGELPPGVGHGVTLWSVLAPIHLSYLCTPRLLLFTLTPFFPRFLEGSWPCSCQNVNNLELQLFPWVSWVWEWRGFAEFLVHGGHWSGGDTAEPLRWCSTLLICQCTWSWSTSLFCF